VGVSGPNEFFGPKLIKTPIAIANARKYQSACRDDFAVVMG